MSSGDWPRCHAAVETVLGGGQLISPFQGCDIRQVSKGSAVAPGRVRTGNRRKRSASLADSAAESEAKFTITGWDECGEDSKDFVIDEESIKGPGHDSFSVEMVEPTATLMQFDERTIPDSRLSEVGLELSLGLNHAYLSTVI